MLIGRLGVKSCCSFHSRRVMLMTISKEADDTCWDLVVVSRKSRGVSKDSSCGLGWIEAISNLTCVVLDGHVIWLLIMHLVVWVCPIHDLPYSSTLLGSGAYAGLRGLRPWCEERVLDLIWSRRVSLVMSWRSKGPPGYERWVLLLLHVIWNVTADSGRVFDLPRISRLIGQSVIANCTFRSRVLCRCNWL